MMKNFSYVTSWVFKFWIRILNLHNVRILKPTALHFYFTFKLSNFQLFFRKITWIILKKMKLLSRLRFILLLLLWLYSVTLIIRESLKHLKLHFVGCIVSDFISTTWIVLCKKIINHESWVELSASCIKNNKK